jgi:hypothetical protein
MMFRMSTTIRVSAASMSQLRYLANRTGTTIRAVVELAIEQQCRATFLEDCNDAYGRLRSSNSAWRRELRERASWDATLGDGLED